MTALMRPSCQENSNKTSIIAQNAHKGAFDG